MGQIFHRRAKIPPKGGNQYYRDKSIPDAKTVCGAEVGYKDVAFHERMNPWTDFNGTEYIPCDRCKHG